MTSILAFATEPAAAAGLGKTALLQSLLAKSELTLGDLADFARGLPEQWVLPAAGTVIDYLGADLRSHRRGRVYRRDLILATMLLSRILQDIEMIPTDPDTEI